MATKKVVQKTVAKKAKAPAPKKAVAKKVNTKEKRVLACAVGEQCFWINEGGVVTNLVELKDHLDRMSKEAFMHHVSGTKNDFADWIQYVLGDLELADSLRDVKKQATTKSIIINRLKMYHI